MDPVRPYEQLAQVCRGRSRVFRQRQAHRLACVLVVPDRFVCTAVVHTNTHTD